MEGICWPSSADNYLMRYHRVFISARVHKLPSSPDLFNVSFFSNIPTLTVTMSRARRGSVHKSRTLLLPTLPSSTGYVPSGACLNLILCPLSGHVLQPVVFSPFSFTNNEECRLLGCDSSWLLLEPTFRRNVSPPLSV
jgi:hypothetical protein